MSCSWFNRRGRPVSWSRTEHTTEHKCAQVMALHTTELALHTTGPICFDSLACLQIAFLTFEYSLQLLVLPNVCLTITENNALTTIVPVTHLNARTPLVFVVRSAGTSGGPSKKKKRPLPARSNAASSLEESRQRCKVSTFGSSGLRTNSGLCRGLKSLQVVPRRVLRTHFLVVINIVVRAFCFCCVLVEFFLLFLSRGCVTT